MYMHYYIILTSELIPCEIHKDIIYTWAQLTTCMDATIERDVLHVKHKLVVNPRGFKATFYDELCLV